MKLITRFLALLILALIPLVASAQEVKLVTDSVTVQAEATHNADPDTAKLVFAVLAQEKELQRAYDKATAAMQRILALAERNGFAKSDVTAGALRVFPIQDYSDKKIKVRSYRVENEITLTTRDFTRIAPLVDEAVQEGIVEFRSLSYSLSDEEAAKQRAIAEATRRAELRARAALADAKRSLGALRAVSIEVKQPVRLYEWPVLRAAVMESYNARFTRSDDQSLASVAPSGYLPATSPGKISIVATVQCIFQLQ